MACLEKRPRKDGTIAYEVNIRKKGYEIYKTFDNEEDARLYSFYKERLIDNMHNFEVPLKERLTIEQIFDLKLKSIDEFERRTINDICKSKERLSMFFDPHKFIHQISYDEWLDCAKKLLDFDVFRGAEKDHNKRKMSLKSLRKIFAYLSASISHANSLGIELDNLPLKVIQTFISPKIKSNNS